MARATLSFKLPEDEGAFLIAQRGIDFYCAILECQKVIREHRKYDKPMEKAFEEIEQIVYEVRMEDIP